MSEQKHTPGPWKINENYNYIEVSSMKESILTFDLKRNVPELCKRQLANAELIARAPELLQQVNAIGELLAIMHGDGGHHQQNVGTKQAILDAIELIHKKWVTNEHLQDINKLSEQVAELTKENERLKARPSLMDKENDNLIKELGRRDERIKALTEQVEKLKEENSRIEGLENRIKRQAELIERCIHPDRLPEVVSRLREREKELVEALRERIYLIGVQDWTKYEKNFLESLLSKFEATEPKQ